MTALLDAVGFYLDHGAMIAAAAVVLAAVVAMAPAAFLRLKRAMPRRGDGKAEPRETSAPIKAAANSDPQELLRSLARARKSSVITFDRPEANLGPEEQSGRREANSRLMLQSFKRQYRALPPKTPIIVLLSEECDLNVSAARVIAKILLAHDGETAAVIPFRVFGPACMIALAVSEVIMSEDSIMVVDGLGLRSAVAAAKLKTPSRMDDIALLRLHEFRQFLREIGWLAELLLRARKVRGWRRISRAIKTGQLNESVPIRVEDLRRWGLRTSVIDFWQLVSEGSRQEPTTTLLASNNDPIIVGTGVPPVCVQSCPIGDVRNAMIALEQRRGTKIVSIIHSKGMSEDSVDDQTIAEALKAIRTTPSGIDLDIILHTPGGQSIGAAQIVHALKAHKGRKTIFVPYRAMSAGTIISLTADEIFLSEIASLGPIDSQIPVARGAYLPAAALASLLIYKKPRDIDDHFLQMAVGARDCIRDDHKKALAAMKKNYPRLRAERIARTLNDGYLSHGFPIMYEEARKIGLNVKLGVPEEVFTIVDSALARNDGFCSVIHCPD